MNKKQEKIKEWQYKYGFKDKIKNFIKFKKGLNEEIVKKISLHKKEPKWMLKFRLEALKNYFSFPYPHFGPDLESNIDEDKINFFIKASKNVANSWNDVPDKIKDTFKKIGIPEAEQKFLSGVSTQYDSETVYHNISKELEEKGIVFLDTDTALKKYPKLFKKYFGTVVSNSDNKYAALNSAVWSGGSFIYIPKNTKLEKPLQSYFRINSNQFGQFERTLIIADENSEITYIEGCTAPIYKRNALHAAVVEIIVHKSAKVRYVTIQNWSTNVINLVTKRSLVKGHARMEWIDGNIGSKINMKYPCCILSEPYATGSTISIAVARKGMIQDAGAKMIHLAPNTKSQIISKTIALDGGQSDYRGKAIISKNADNSFAKVQCETLLLDKNSSACTIPDNVCFNSNSFIEHEATVSKINKDQLFYLMSRGFSEQEATEIIVLGFVEPFARELPMEYAVELNQLIKLEMEGSIG